MYCVKDIVALCKEAVRAFKASRVAFKASAKEYADQLKDVDVSEYDAKKAEAPKAAPAKNAADAMKETLEPEESHDETEKPVIWHYDPKEEPKAQSLIQPEPTERRSDTPAARQADAAKTAESPVEKKAADMTDAELDAMLSGK
jgi:hypothetical protein